MWSRIRYRDIFRRWSRIRYRGISSIMIFVDACGGGCIRFRENISRRNVRDGSGNSWCRCRGNNSRKIGRDINGCSKKCRGESSLWLLG